jgi:hypothetical protein
MAGLRFTELQSRPMEFLDCTSLTLDEFQQLVPPFETAFHARMAAWRMDGKPRTARRFTVYKNCPLLTPEDRLLFILVYIKTYALQGNRSASENLTLAIWSPYGLPCRHGNTVCITTRGVGTDPTRGASLYSGAGSTCGDLDLHGPRLTGAGLHVAGTAEPDVTEFFPPPIERFAPASTSKPPPG